MSATGGAFDFAIQGEGFFLIETPDGQRLTRAGAFTQNLLLWPNVKLESPTNSEQDDAFLIKLSPTGAIAWAQRFGGSTSDGILGLTVSKDLPIVVGRYSAVQLGYHALGWAPTSVVVTMVVGLLTGVQVMTARAIGEGRRHETGAVLRRGLSYSVWIGLASMVILVAGGPAFLHVLGLAPDLADGASGPLLILRSSARQSPHQLAPNTTSTIFCWPCAAANARFSSARASACSL